MRDNDTCSLQGAKRLRYKIEQYWLQRSDRFHEPKIRIEQAGYRNSRSEIRSDMVNGQPRRKEC